MKIPFLRLQSAMEYLMTYGWAVLAIAIVMVSLYSLGIFNTGSLQPTANPGSCEVVRTVAQTSLAGQCSNLIPKYVAQLNGQSSSVVTGTKRLSLGSVARSAAAWIYWEGTNTSCGFSSVFSYGYNNPANLSDFGLHNNANVIYFGGYADDANSNFVISPNAWYFIGYSYATGASSIYIYVNQQVQNASFGGGSAGPLNTVLAPSNASIIGRRAGTSGCYFAGYIANVQAYNISLDNASMLALYREGVGGAPIDVQHLVGWWPLNGNANDYSGNNNQGTATNIKWDANWQSGYTAPAS